MITLLSVRPISLRSKVKVAAVVTNLMGSAFHSESLPFWFNKRACVSGELPADDVSEPPCNERANHSSRCEESSRQRPGELNCGVGHVSVTLVVCLIVERLYQLTSAHSRFLIACLY